MMQQLYYGYCTSLPTEMYQYMDYLAAEFPQLVTVQKVGRSVERRELRLVKVSNGGPPKPAVFIEGGVYV